MSINQLLEHLYWLSAFGKSKRKISPEELFAKPELIKNPVFFLSTGRSGTAWFTHLLSKVENTVVLHNPSPSLSVQNKFMYNLLQTDSPLKLDTAVNMLFAAREQHFRYAYKADKRLVETNNHITFFAYALASLFPTAKFVHLYRHPGEFVTSGLNRGWFDHNKAASEKIIKSNDSEKWENYNNIQKIAWVWNETNEFIESFKESFTERVTSYNFSRRSVTELEQVLSFLDIRLPKSFLEQSLKAKKNEQKTRTYAPYEEWDASDQEMLKAICGDLIDTYQFKL